MRTFARKTASRLLCFFIDYQEKKTESLSDRSSRSSADGTYCGPILLVSFVVVVISVEADAKTRQILTMLGTWPQLANSSRWKKIQPIIFIIIKKIDMEMICNLIRGHWDWTSGNWKSFYTPFHNYIFREIRSYITRSMVYKSLPVAARAHPTKLCAFKLSIMNLKLQAIFFLWSR